MIKYKLSCENCSQDFDSWFASSKEYEKLKKSLAHQRNEAKKQKRRRAKEEEERLSRKKNADLWNSLKLASQLSSSGGEEPRSTVNPSGNPFL